jgi:signal transduction histidine kinase
LKFIKIVTLLVFFIFSICVVKASNEAKLKSEAYAAKELYNAGNYKDCLNKSLELRQDAIKHNNLSAELYFTGLITNCYFYMYDYQKALFFGLLGERRFKNPNDSLQAEGYYFCAFVLADFYYKIGKLPSSYKRYWKIYYYSSLNKGEINNIQIYNSIGILLFKQNKYAKSKEFFFKGLKTLKPKNVNHYFYHHRRQEIFDNIGITYYKLNDYANAKAYYDSALIEIGKLDSPSPNKSSQQKIARAVVLGNLAKVLIKEKKFSLAIEYCKENINVNLGIDGLKEEGIRSLLDIATAYMETDSVILSKKYIDEAEILIKKFNFRELLPKFLYTSAQYEKKKGNIAKALSLFEQYNTIQDSIKIIDIDNSFYQNLSENELNEAQNQLSSLREKEKLERSSKEKSLLISILSGFLLFVFFLVFIFFRRSYLKEKKLKEELLSINGELKNINNDLNKLIVEKNEIIGFVAHDLRGPLASNIGLQKILFDKINNTKQDADIPIIFNYLELNNSYLTEVTEDLVEAANLERIDFSLDLAKDNLSNVLNEIEVICKPDALNKKLNIFIEHPEVEVIINLNKEKFKRAVLNIVSNAMKFTPEEGSIFCTVEVINNSALLKIKDTGVGISEENLKVVFDKFSNASRKGVRGEKSNGLGLYIVAKIIELHGGEISIKSQEMEGTEILISLPLAT